MEFPLSDRRRRLPPRPPNGAWTRRQLLRDGWTDAGLRRALGYGAVVQPGHGVYCDPLAGEELALLQVLTADGTQMASHATAAALHGVSGFILERPLHLTSPRSAGRVRREGVVPHRSTVPAEQVTVVAGVRVTSPGRTWVDLALGLSQTQAVVLADQMLRSPRREFGEQGESILELSELRAAVALRRRSRGIRTVRQAAELARVGADSPQETRLRLAMWRDGLPEPRVNPKIFDDRGRVVLQPDLAIDEYRIAIQYDGVEVHSDPQQVLKDVRRAERAEAMGWLELRITKDHSRGFWRAGLLKIRRALYSRGWDGR
ncbi:hypothetical protein [Nesterenkonia xinjiangensis]|uniref:Transcriptional regulator, AbiEi antitoxin, Type IV TA system n=1 Tax=Nesterenkonia xinjiangensis TaxID=225327 RepID=A0A7Z0GKA2_9MICC|nr:hypothetical protein [Nesterenkonia xinjiangensis]NYJ77530.1 hypothetical protein [Nesterenkonia xinjiangensis]